MRWNLTLKQRFDSKWMPEPFSGCWLWTGFVDSNGYGAMKIDRKQTKAHRVSWSLFRGVIPDGLFVCHVCDTPLCVNPQHLFIGTIHDNLADMRRKHRDAPPLGEQHGACLS